MSKPKIRFKGCQGEWSSSTFVDTFQFLKNNSLSRACLGSNGDVKNVHYGDVLIRFGENLDVGKEALPYISNGSYGRALAKRCSLQDGDVIIADAAEDNTVGKATELMSVGDNTVVSGLHTIPCRPTLTFGPCYLGYYLNSKAYHNQLLPLIQGTKICSISKHALENTTVSYPPTLPEQRQIASYFRSLDGILSGCEARLSSLRRLKEGALQAFFPQQGETQPRIRFKGCKGEWERKKLGEIGAFYGGITGKSKADFANGNAKFITYMNVYKNPALRLDLDNKVRIEKNEKQRTLRYGDILFTGSSETPDECGMSSVITEQPTEDLYLNSFCFFLRLNHPAILEPDFAKQLFRSNELRRQIVRTASGITRYNVSKKLMKDVNIPIPPLPEQHLIANFFRTIDLRIELERQRLEKLKQLKAACLEKMFV